MPLPSGSDEDDRWVPAKFKNLSDAEKKGIIASYYTLMFKPGDQSVFNERINLSSIIK